MILRDYQDAAREEAHAMIDAGHKRILIHSGTGTGKTVIAADITKRAVALGHRVLFLAHRKELIDQAWNKLRSFGVDASVLMANDSRRAAWKSVCVASVPTLVRRPHKPTAALLIIDECHRSPANSYVEILKSYPDAIVLGLTATPIRTDSKGLGDLFDVMVSCPSVGEMMRRLDPETGKPYLVGTRVFAPPAADVSKVKTVRGDYKNDELAKICDKPKLVGDIVDHWRRHASGRRTIAFAVGVEHSKHIVAGFSEAGITAEHLDGTTPKEEREGILARLESGKTLVVSNVGVLTEGFDCPPVSCIILARPTQSMGLFLQMCGRALRPYPGKDVVVILDHSGAHHQHGFIDDDREWSLTPSEKAKETGASESVFTCKNSWMNCECGKPEIDTDDPVRLEGNHDTSGTHWPCYHKFRSGPDACPQCGCPILRKERKIDTVDAPLVELRRPAPQAALPIPDSLAARVAGQFQLVTQDHAAKLVRRDFEFLLARARREGRKPGWAKHVMEARTGHRVPPDWMPAEWRAEKGL